MKVSKLLGYPGQLRAGDGGEEEKGRAKSGLNTEREFCYMSWLVCACEA